MDDALSKLGALAGKTPPPDAPAPAPPAPAPEAGPEQKPRSAREALSARGILEAAEAAGWKPKKAYDRAGFEYPVYNRDGQEIGKRWKNVQHDPAADGDPGKYRWLPKKPVSETHLYYLLPDTVEAIVNNRGVLYLASGEPDVIAFRAAKVSNTLCWFDGEDSVPPTLAEDLKALGVVAVRHWPDNDATGHSSAAKVRDLLADSSIRYEARRLPGEFGNKMDINQVWIDSKFDSLSFLMALENCPVLELPETPKPDTSQEMFRPESQTRTGQGDGTWFREYVETLKATIAMQKSKREGSVTRYQCVNPAHPDKHPSARISYDRDSDLGIYICTCSTGGSEADVNWETVGGWMGKTWDDFKKRKFEEQKRESQIQSTQPVRADQMERPVPAEQPSAPPAPKERELTTEPFIDPSLLSFSVDSDQIPIPLDRIMFSSDDAARLYRDRLRGIYVMSRRPVTFPFRAFHHLGGLFQVASPGDIYGILGLSGYGKSSFIESSIDIKRRDGEHVLLISPEIPWWKMADRLVQRQGGMAVTDSLLNDLYNYEVKHSGHAAFGRKSSKVNVEDSIGIIDDTQENWPGKLFTIDQFGANVEYFFAAIYKAVAELSKQGLRPSSVYLDYVQLMHAPREWFGKMTYEDMIRQFKALMFALGTVGYVTSQVRKAETREVMETGSTYGQDAGMFLRDFQFKGYATMTPGFKNDPITGEKVPASYTIFNCTKNSDGKKGKVELETQWHRTLFVDHEPGAERGNADLEPSGKQSAPMEDAPAQQREIML